MKIKAGSTVFTVKRVFNCVEHYCIYKKKTQRTIYNNDIKVIIKRLLPIYLTDNDIEILSTRCKVIEP